MWYKPKKMSVFVTRFRQKRQLQLAVIEENTGRFGIHKTLVDEILRLEGLFTLNRTTISMRSVPERKARETLLYVMFLQNSNSQ